MKKQKEKPDIRPTVQQIQYLQELARVGTERGYISVIAENCKVNHGTVSRYFKLCREKEILTPADAFTPIGKRWLEGYSKLLEDLTRYLKHIGVADREIPNQRKQMIENLDYHVLVGMVRKQEGQNRSISADRKEAFRKDFYREILIHGTYPVGFAVYKMGDKKEFSMADQGFVKPAVLRHNKRGGWLVLKTCPLKARSRIDGKWMSGYLDSLKYEQDGLLHRGEVRNGELRIPLEAFTWNKRQGGELSGSILLTVSCSVGRMHMPESTAVLVFWA